MNKKRSLVLLLSMVGLSSTALAEGVTSTTSVYVSLRDCAAGETVCDGINRSHERAIGGVPGSQEACP